MTNFTKEQLQGLYDEAKKIKASQPKDMNENEYLQTVLMKEIDNLSQTEADGIIDRMESAIRDYNAGYNQGVETGSIPAESMLTEAINANNMNDQEAINFLASTIVLIRNYGKDINELNDESLKAQVAELTEGREVDSSTVQSLIEEAASAIRSSDVMAIDAHTASELAATPFDASLVASIREHAQSPLYLSVAAYIAASKGELEISENEVSPESIALGVATGMKIQEISADLSEGKIDLPTWAKYVKVALGVALALSVSILALPILAAFSVNMILGAFVVFGSFTASLFFGALMTIGVVIFTGIKIYDRAEQIWEAYSKMFEKAYAWIANLNVKEKVKEYYIATKNKIMEYIRKAKGLLNQQQVQQPAAEVVEPTVVEEEIVSERTMRPLTGM